MKSPSKWYPQRKDFPTDEQWNAHVQTLKNVYTIADKVEAHADKLKQAETDIAALKQQPAAGGPTNTQIAGILVKPGIPTAGQTLKYNAQTNQLEWG